MDGPGSSHNISCAHARGALPHAQPWRCVAGRIELPMFRLAPIQQRLSSWLARTDICDRLALAAFALLAVLVLLTFGDYAISNDETVQHRYGELILAYYASGF